MAEEWETALMPDGDVPAPDGGPGPVQVARRSSRPRLVLTALLAAAVLALLWALTRVPGMDAPGAPSARTPMAGGLPAGNPVRGRDVYLAEGCAECHGQLAEGGRFPGAPQLAGRGLTCDHLLRFVRRPPDPAKGMPPYSAAQVSDTSVGDICAWIDSVR